MKIKILRDAKGNAMASFESTPQEHVQIEPELAEGTKIEEMEVPEDYTDDPAAFMSKISSR